jgi:hypothetical protein
MAKNTIADLSVTPASNTDLLGQNSTGSADSNTLDTIIQNLTGILARAYGDQGGLGTVGGSANAITLTSQSTYQQYQSGLQIAFKASAANTGAATLNLDGLGVKKIRRRGDSALVAGDIVANGRYLLQYDAAYDVAAGAWVLMDQEIPAYLVNLATAGVPVFTCGQLQYSTTTVVKLMPMNGNLVSFPSGAVTAIPSTGISSTITSAYLNGVASQSLAANTVYYGYLWNQGSASSPNYVIDWSTTSHAADTTTGIEIKSGDATRVLVGMIRTNTGPVVADTATARLVASWHNRRPKQLRNAFSTDRSTTSTGFTEINSEIRCNFLSWGDAISMAYAGNVSSSSGTISAFSGPSVDSATTGFPATSSGSVTTVGLSLASSGVASVTEGFHYITTMGAVSSGTGVWNNSSQGGSLTGLVII